MVLFNFSLISNLFSLVYSILSSVHRDSWFLYSHLVFTIYRYKKSLPPPLLLELFCCRFHILCYDYCFLFLCSWALGTQQTADPFPRRWSTLQESVRPCSGHTCVFQRWVSDAHWANQNLPLVWGTGTKDFTQLCHLLDLRGYVLGYCLCHGHLPIQADWKTEGVDYCK